MDLVTVAEGIEGRPQLDRLRALGCRFGQGFYFARPVPAAEFEARLPGGPSAGGVGHAVATAITREAPAWPRITVATRRPATSGA